MARFWTSPNSCAYVPDYVYITLNLPQPIPEPDYDVFIASLVKTVRQFAIDEGGVTGRRYRVDEDTISEDNPIATIDGTDYVTYTGILKIMCHCDHGDAENLQSEVEYIAKDYEARITEVEICGDY